MIYVDLRYSVTITPSAKSRKVIFKLHVF